MKLILITLTILASITASAQKQIAPCDTLWTPVNRFDTMQNVPAEDKRGRIIKVSLIYQHGVGCSGDVPKIVGYIGENKKRLREAQKPKRIRWDKM